MNLAEATEVATKTNAAYGLRVGDHLQTEQILLETNVAYELSEQENPAEQVTELVYPFNSASQIPLHSGTTPHGFTNM